MKVISVWQPWASLIVHGYKVIETRGWAAPKSLIGQKIGIAATKRVTPAQRAAFNDEEFRAVYDRTILGDPGDLPMGCILGTVVLNSCDLITEECLDDITSEELAFGWYESGRYAWRLRRPDPFKLRVYTRGSQGIWDWDGYEGQRHCERELDAREEAPRYHLSLI